MRKRGVALVLTAAVACNLAGCGGTVATKNETTKSDTAQSETCLLYTSPSPRDS